MLLLTKICRLSFQASVSAGRIRKGRPETCQPTVEPKQSQIHHHRHWAVGMPCRPSVVQATMNLCLRWVKLQLDQITLALY